MPRTPQPARTLTLRDAKVDGKVVDVTIREGVIEQIGSIDVPLGEELHLDGRTLMPGLWDAHVHMTQWAMHAKRISTFDAASAREAADLMRRGLEALGDLTLGDDGLPLPLVGSGFRDGLWPDVPTTELLDAVSQTIPIVVVSSDLHSTWLNTAALERFGFAGHPTGLLREDPAFDVERQLDDLPESVIDRWIHDACQHAASRGIVGFTELEMTWNVDPWLRRRSQGNRLQRVEAGVYPHHLDRAIAAGIRTGDALGDLLTAGPLKVLTDGSLGTRTAYCFDPYPGMTGEAAHGLLTVPPEELEAMLRRASAADISPAVHAIGDHANALALDVFARLGIRGRIEHAQLLTHDDIARFGALGITASVQPQHAIDDRDLTDMHWHGRTERAFVLQSLLDAGATLMLGSDAPVSQLDPWVAIAAATHRTDDARTPWHQEEAISVADAMTASVRTSLEPGQPADLVATDADPASADPAALRTMPVALTMVDGEVTHSTL